MPIVVNLDVMLAKRQCHSKTLAAAVNLTEVNISILRSGRARAIRFSTLYAICDYLQCQPGDILEFRPDEPNPHE